MEINNEKWNNYLWLVENGTVIENNLIRNLIKPLNSLK